MRTMGPRPRGTAAVFAVSRESANRSHARLGGPIVPVAFENDDGDDEDDGAGTKRADPLIS